MPEHDLRSARPPETVVVLAGGVASIMLGWQAEPEPEPPFWPKLLVVGAVLFGILAVGFVWVS